MPTKTAELGNTILEPSMSDDEEGWGDGQGAFPTLTSSIQEDEHIFTDEPLDSSYYSVVEEGSKESKGSKDPSTGESLTQDEYIAGGVARPDSPAINNTMEATMEALKRTETAAFGPQANRSMNSSGYYPYTMYQSLAKNKTAEENNDKKIFISSRQGGKDREESSMPPQINQNSFDDDESSSVFTDVVEEAASTQAPYSTMSAQTPRDSSKQYVVRHTLPTSQEVSVNPSAMLKNLFISIEQERQMHKLASQNLKAVNNWFFFLPAILLSLLSGVVVLIFETDLEFANSDARVYSSIFVGVAALASVLFQAIGKQLDLSTRSSMHEATAVALKRLSEDILLNLSSMDAIPAEYVALISEKFAQALDSCPSVVPYNLETAFALVSDRMVLIVRPRMGQLPRKHVAKLDFMRLYAMAYGELAAEIIDHWAWPFAYPQPRKASDSALRNFKAIITEGREGGKNKGFLRIFFPWLGKDEVERSLFDILPPASVSGL